MILPICAWLNAIPILLRICRATKTRLFGRATWRSSKSAAADAVYGDIDAVVSGPAAAECEAIDALVEIEPTTLPGVARFIGSSRASLSSRPRANLRSSHKAVDR